MLPPLPLLFGCLAEARGLVLAVSGGPDSIALLHLAAAWKPAHLAMQVACVDHGLRPEARTEAEGVVAAASACGLPATVLPWTGDKPRSRLQERARDARYRLLSDHARAVGASHVVTAHTLDDQAETMLMRIAAGSGPRGLIGMRPLVRQGDIHVARPFLSVRKAALVELCLERGWPFIDDPSNTDPRFARVRWRRLAGTLAGEGLTPERLDGLARRLERADSALASVADGVATACRKTAPDGSAHFAVPLFDQPDEIVLRVLDKAFRAIAPEAPARLQKLETLLAALRHAQSAKTPLRRTLQGCIVTLLASGDLAIRTEPPRRDATLLNAKR